MANTKNQFDELKTLIGVLKPVHNKRIIEAYKNKVIDTEGNEIADNNHLAEILKINQSDNINLVTLKILTFNLVYERLNAVGTVPELDPRVIERFRPQLVITLKPLKWDSKNGKYAKHRQFKIPHFDGSTNISLPSFRIGSYRTTYNFKDRSQIRFATSSESEGLKMIEACLKYTKPEKRFSGDLADSISQSKSKIDPVLNNVLMVPKVATYYEFGKYAKQVPTWRILL